MLIKSVDYDDLFKHKTEQESHATYITHNEILKQSKNHHTSEPQKQSFRTRIYEIKTYTNLPFILSIIINLVPSKAMRNRAQSY